LSLNLVSAYGLASAADDAAPLKRFAVPALSQVLKEAT
jgi:hypothetical protein